MSADQATVPEPDEPTADGYQPEPTSAQDSEQDAPPSEDADQ